MARCGCTPKCTCAFVNGACTTAQINASQGECGATNFSYAIDVVTDNETVFCGDSGLEAVVNHLDTNTVDLEGDGSGASPLEAHVIRTPDANVPDPDGIGIGNLVKELPGAGGGIYVSCEDVQDCVGAAIDVMTADCLDYDDTINSISIKICAEPNGIECVPAGAEPGCPDGGLAVFPSSDPDNSLVFGSDDRLYTEATAIEPGECMSFTGTGTASDPFVVSPLVAPEQNGLECVPGSGLLVVPSSDPDNGLGFGGDNRLYIDTCPLSLAGSQVLVGNTGPCFEFVGGGCNVPLVATMRLSDDTCQGLECRGDGLYVQVDDTDLPAAVQIVRTFGPFGPFNGSIPVGSLVLDQVCLQLTNPSPCRTLITKGVLTGFADTGRTSGEFRFTFDIQPNGGADPWFAVSQMGQKNPNPASRQTQNAVWTGSQFMIGPGGTRTMCFRLTFNSTDLAQPVNNGRIFTGQYFISLVGRWATD